MGTHPSLTHRVTVESVFNGLLSHVPHNKDWFLRPLSASGKGAKASIVFLASLREVSKSSPLYSGPSSVVPSNGKKFEQFFYFALAVSKRVQLNSHFVEECQMQIR